jgi:hypothetical protein
LIEAAIEHVITIQIHAKDTWEMSTYGFDVKEAFDRYQKEMSEMV